MAVDLLAIAVPAAILGALSHATYFIRGEHHVEGPTIFMIIMIGPAAVVALLVFAAGTSISDAFTSVFIGFWSLVLGLFTSMGVYRAFFHRLGHIPGPFGARLTKFWWSFMTIDAHGDRKFKEMHDTYGDIVRTGPNEVSVFTPEALELVHGPRSSCKKSIWYDASLPRTSVHQMRDRSMHDRRRKGGWEKAFNSKSMRAYESRITDHADVLLRYLATHGEKGVNASKVSMWYTWDVMGMLAFSKSFDNLESGESHWAIQVMHAQLKPLAFFSPVAWALHLLNKIPTNLNPIERFIRYCGTVAEERKKFSKPGGTAAAGQQKIAPYEQDVYTYLLEEENFFGDKHLDNALMEGDARLIIIAGSDTTSGALTAALYHLNKTPSLLHKLREELHSNDMHGPTGLTPSMLSSLPFLNALIHETLRLHPPVAGPVYRDTPPEGLQIGETFIPGNVTILTPTYAIQTSSKSYKEPLAFIPERWSTRPELVLKKDAWLPFLLGPYGCVGKQVALAELRIVLAKLVLAFDMKFAPGEDGKDFLENTLDCFTPINPPLNICFTKRKAN